VAETPHDRDLLEAIIDLRSYLSDLTAPLLVTDAVATLFRHPPEVMAEGIDGWVSQQVRVHQVARPASDFLYHAARKLYLLGELELVPPKALNGFLTRLLPLLVERCPPAGRERLAAELARLDRTGGELAPSNAALYAQQPREAAAGGEGGEVLSEEVARGLRRFTALLERLETAAGGEGEGEGEGAAGGAERDAGGRAALASQLFAAAAQNAQSAADLAQYLEQLRRAGLVDADPKQAIRALSESLPDWAVAGEGGAGYHGGSEEALHRVVTLADNPRESAERYREMMATAIEQFNGGSLARAVTILELASRIEAEKKVPASTAAVIRGSVHESLDPEQLRRAAGAPERHPLLRKLLAYFPQLAPDALLADLQSEPQRQRRRLLISLLEVWGAPARAAALEALLLSFTETTGGEAWHFQRNLVYLLRRIDSPAIPPPDRELDCVLTLCDVAQPPPLVREVVPYLGQVPHERAERALIGLLGKVEAQLADPGTAMQTVDELDRLASQLTLALARFGTGSARRAVVGHALRDTPGLGDTISRAADLEGVDLSAEPDLVGRLVEALRAQFPTKVLGFTVGRREDNMLPVVRALSATRHPAVQAVFGELIAGFPQHPATAVAREALVTLDRPEKPAPAAAAKPEPAVPASVLEGDLEVFGLPNLLQTLAQSEVTGRLVMIDRDKRPLAQLLLVGGELAGCTAGHLSGEAAFFQLLERPVATGFHLDREASLSSREGSRPLLPLLLEGMRRYDEYQRACALAPDGMRFESTGQRPTAPPGETDGALVREVWTRAKGGSRAVDCEIGMAVDPYRIRVLLAHWLEEGALEPLR
jgi:hypothetical protein